MARKLSFVGLVGLFLVACSARSDPGDAAASASTSADNDAIVGMVPADSAIVEDDRITFPSSALPALIRQEIDAYQAQLRAGAPRDSIESVILSGDRQKDAADATGKISPSVGNPYGFVRRAVSYADQGDKTVVMTEHVSLDEAFEEFNSGAVISVGSTAPRPTGFTTEFDKSLHYTIPVINLDGKQLWSDGPASLKLKTGHVNLDTNIDLGADIASFSLSEAHVVVDANIDSEVVVEAVLGGPIKTSVSQPIYQGSWAVGSIGPVPVTLGLSVTAECDLEADGEASASAGVGMNIHLNGGVKYDRDNGTSPVWDSPTFTPRVIAPAFSVKANATAACHIKPQVSLMLFDSAGPNLTPDLAAKLSAQYPNVQATVTGEIGLDVGGQLSLFGKDLGSVNYHLFTYDKQLWSYEPE